MSKTEVIVEISKEKTYPILIGTDLLKTLGTELRHINLRGKVLILTNPKINRLYGKTIKSALDKSGFATKLLEIKDGEAYKTLDTAAQVYTVLIENNFERTSTIVALGGGVIGDIAGFVAATFLRGINLVQVPTTLLAQVDSSVGGKTGVNHKLGKNLIGAFYQPKLVLADTGTLHTLPEREILSGIAEVLKYGLIYDSSFFNYLEKTLLNGIYETGKGLTLTDIDLQRIVSRCCEIKADVVQKDEKENNLRAILNFGHTFGHALETATSYKTLTHGEAVALGMLCAVQASIEKKLDPEILTSLEKVYTKIKLPRKIGLDLDKRLLLKLMQNDKKVADGTIRLVLLKSLGVAHLEKADQALITDAFKTIL